MMRDDSRAAWDNFIKVANETFREQDRESAEIAANAMWERMREHVEAQERKDYGAKVWRDFEERQRALCHPYYRVGGLL